MSCNCHGKCVVAVVAWVLVIIGGLNWGLVGVGMLTSMNLNLVNLAFGSMPTLEAAVYLIVALATLFSIVGCSCKKCKEECMTCVAKTEVKA